MRRVLVPLDGTELATTIFPDACRLAGRNGTLILVLDANWLRYDKETGTYADWSAVKEAGNYLHAQAAALREQGVRVEVHRILPHDIVWGIDAAAEVFHADMIACATHGRGPLGRLVHGGMAWRMVAHSPVPVLLRHPEDMPATGSSFAGPRRIMVPLDGSEYAEKALPLAQQRALEWHAPLWLVRVVRALAVYSMPYSHVGAIQCDHDRHMAEAYLEQIAHSLPGAVHTHVSIGGIVDNLVELAKSSSITDIILASHGRTGLSRVILGSVADELIHRLHCPILVIPALATGRLEGHDEVVRKEVTPVGV